MEIIGKPEGVDTPEEKAFYEGKKCCVGASDEEVEITKSFWATPCGYWTQCFHIKWNDGRTRSVMRGEIRKFL